MQGPLDEEQTKKARAEFGLKDGQPPLFISPNGDLGLLMGANQSGQLMIVELEYKSCGYLKPNTIHPAQGEHGSNVDLWPNGGSEQYGEPIHHD